MSCEACDLLIQLALDDLLERSQKEAMEQHLHSCPACRKKYEEFVAIRQAIRTPEPLPEGLHEKILHFVEEHTEEQAAPSLNKPPLAFRRPMKMLAGIAACALVLFCAARFLPEDKETPMLTETACSADCVSEEPEQESPTANGFAAQPYAYYQEQEDDYSTALQDCSAFTCQTILVTGDQNHLPKELDPRDIQNDCDGEQYVIVPQEQLETWKALFSKNGFSWEVQKNTKEAELDFAALLLKLE